MKRKLFTSFVFLCMMVSVLLWLGIGSYSSSSAVRDLKTELETIYGAEYTGKDTENGIEDMVFVVEPKTWFMTNWSLRNALRIDYKYECKVIFTTFVEGNAASVRTITYQAVDPMGADKTTKRAFLNLGSKVEITENK